MEQQEQRALTGGSVEALQQSDKRLLGAATGKLLTDHQQARRGFGLSMFNPCTLFTRAFPAKFGSPRML